MSEPKIARGPAAKLGPIWHRDGEKPYSGLVEVAKTSRPFQKSCGARSVTRSILPNGNVLEIVEDDDGDTDRAGYTVKFSPAVDVLHAFQKKSKQGIATPNRDLDRIDERLKRADTHVRQRLDRPNEEPLP